MRWFGWLGRRDDDAGDVEHGKPGPVLDADGEPAVGPDGKPLEKVLVTIRRDWMGNPVEAAWMDPRVAWQWEEPGVS